MSTETGSARIPSEMVERVARAILAAPSTWSGDTDDEMMRCARAQARAAIAEMRDPSRRMLRAMCRAMSPKHRPTPDWVGSDEKHRMRWQAAVEAALSEPEPSS